MTPRGQRTGNRYAALQLTLRGFTAREISDLLGIAPGTVYAHRYNLRRQGRLKEDSDGDDARGQGQAKSR